MPLKRRPGNPAVLELRGSHTKYYLWDEGNGLVGNPNVTLVLSWNIVPHAGRLRDARGNGPHSINFPAEYSAEMSSREMRGQRLHLKPPEAWILSDHSSLVSPFWVKSTLYFFDVSYFVSYPFWKHHKINRSCVKLCSSAETSIQSTLHPYTAVLYSCATVL